MVYLPMTDRAAPDADEQQAPGRLLRVLVAEDHAINQKFLAIILNSIGAESVMTGNGAEALAHALKEPFDILLFDLRMPEMSGLEALRKIRSSSLLNALAPAIALTADCTVSTRQALIDEGFVAVVAKPFSPTELVLTMRDAMHNLESGLRSEATDIQGAAPIHSSSRRC